MNESDKMKKEWDEMSTGEKKREIRKGKRHKQEQPDNKICEIEKSPFKPSRPKAYKEDFAKAAIKISTQVAGKLGHKVQQRLQRQAVGHSKIAQRGVNDLILSRAKRWNVDV